MEKINGVLLNTRPYFDVEAYIKLFRREEILSKSKQKQ